MEESQENQRELIEQAEEEEFIKRRQSVLVDYYQYNYTYIKLQIIDGIFVLVAKSVLFMLLCNAADTRNIFGIMYFIAGFLTWKSKNNMKIMIKITNFAIFMLLTQYLLLALNINKQTSPIPFPEKMEIPSLLALITGNKDIQNNEWIKVIGFGKIELLGVFNMIRV